jgi:hypothetical protein
MSCKLQRKVDGIGNGNGLAKQGEDTFKFLIRDNKGRVHTIKILNSLYLPKLRQCFCHHNIWCRRRETGKHEWIFCTRVCLNWKGEKKTAPFNSTTNTPIFFMSPSSCTYHVFTLTFEALEGPYFHMETVFQFSRCRYTANKPALVPEEFVVEENINFCKHMSVDE